MAITQGRIDVHHHIIPPVFADAIRSHGLDHHAGAPLPKWSPELSLEVMDVNGISRAITSITTPGVHLGGGVDQAKGLARDCNEYAAQMRRDFPHRFGNFAVLPIPFTEASCAEAIYALDVLKAEGVVLFGSTEGVFLGDPRLDELMSELNARKTVVFVHPNLHKTSEELGFQAPGYLMEFLCDTTRGAVNLVFSGAMERFPNIRWILSHSGGFLPFIAWQLAETPMTPELEKRVPKGILHYLKEFYFDTALSPSRYSIATIKEFANPARIMFGSDFPFAPAPIVTLECTTLASNTQWSEPQKYSVSRGNALNLFPQYRTTSETITPEPIYTDEGVGSRFRRSVAETMAELAEGMRNR